MGKHIYVWIICILKFVFFFKLIYNNYVNHYLQVNIHSCFKNCDTHELNKYFF